MAKRAPLMCRNGCGQQIWFDWERKFDDLGYTNNATKPNIPLEVNEEGEHLPKKHQCPNSEYAKKQQQQQQGAGTSFTERFYAKDNALQDILGAVMDIKMQQEELRKEFNEFVPRFNQLVDMVAARQGNPLDDDGDSSRENGEPPEQ